MTKITFQQALDRLFGGGSPIDKLYRRVQGATVSGSGGGVGRSRRKPLPKLRITRRRRPTVTEDPIID